MDLTASPWVFGAIWRPLSWIFAEKTKASQHEGGYEGGARKVEGSTDHNKNPRGYNVRYAIFLLSFSGIWRWVKQVAKRLVHAFLNN